MWEFIFNYSVAIPHVDFPFNQFQDDTGSVALLALAYQKWVRNPIELWFRTILRLI